MTDRNSSTANVSAAFTGDSNYSDTDLDAEANSTFKCPHFVRDSPSLLLGEWFKRSLYQPQNRSLVGYWKLDGNANGLVEL